MTAPVSTDKPSQSDKFKDAAREALSDENRARWQERSKKVATHQPDNPE